MKRFLCIFFALMIVLTLPAFAAEGENLVSNGDFSEIDSMGLPKGWTREMWISDEGVSRLYVDENGYDGNCIVIFNADANDARFTQTVYVEPGSVYRFSCMVKAEECGSEGSGATLSFDQTYSYSESILDTAGEWRELTVYGRTGSQQDQVVLMARVGGYSLINTGRAYFDDIECVKVDIADIPRGAEIVSLEPWATSSGSSSNVTKGSDAPARNTEAYLLGIALYGIFILAIFRRTKRISSSHICADNLLVIGLVAAFVLRTVLALRVYGYSTDINCFSSWSQRIYELGPAHFYSEDYFCDYPPGYMLILWIPAALRRILGFGFQSAGYLLLLKLTPILCDILGALLIWRVAKKRKANPIFAALVALIFALNPAIFIDSAAWGQIDSVFTLLIALCALEAVDERYIPSLIAFAAAILIKPQAMLFGPLGLFAILFSLLQKRNPRKLREFLTGIVGALALIYAVAFVFYFGNAQSTADAIVGPVRWIANLYSNTFVGYKYLTVNALNLYTLLGFNWNPTTDHPLWTTIASILFGLSYIYAGFLYLKSKKRRHLLLTGGLLITLIFVFGPMIHERYIYPAILLLTLAYLFERDRRLLLVLTILTITTAMNELLVLQGGMTEANYGHLQSSEQWLNCLLALINIANALYLCWVSLDICVYGHIVALRYNAEETAAAPIPAQVHRLNLRWRDYLLMAAVTAVYSVVTFVNLGSTVAPQSTWMSTQSGENIVFDLGDVQSSRMIYYGNICNSTFTVELSNDGENWTEPKFAEYKQGLVFKWLFYVPMTKEGESFHPIYGATIDPGDGSAYITYPTHGTDEYPYQTARYIRITAESAGLKLNEIAFLDSDGAPLPVRIAWRSGEHADFASDPELLIDEQDTVPAIPTYLNGTYFDEIYHARTAYELAEGDIGVYEWTHPPLGKVIMMLGIQIFGMTPFGWRFMGALIGVLMLPLMYLLAKQLTKSTKLSFIAMTLMALDAMHFTQTRIATIDSYAVFWIMLMYLFMIRYIQMDWQQVKFSRTFVPLGLCGIAMGLGWATKWICIYASAGLAILFFWKLFKELSHAGKDPDNFWARAAGTVFFCIVFFVIVPLLIYYLSYTRQLRVEGVTNIFDMFSRERFERVIKLQETMFKYHAGLGDDPHFYRSPWYQWPIIWWPMWYFSGTDYLTGDMISSISCMGNPAVWWSGLVALILLVVFSAWKRRTPKNWLIVLIGFASQFLPWVLVPRSTFIYHYFASVPFIILCTVLALDWLREHSKDGFKWTSIVLLSLALILFVAFYPLESGLPVARSYAQYLRWFNWYNF